jgi:hypothetical protein
MVNYAGYGRDSVQFIQAKVSVKGHGTMFSPFYTKRRGSGAGLAMVKQKVEGLKVNKRKK